MTSLDARPQLAAGQENITRLRELWHGIKLATLEFAERCQLELDGPGSKTTRDIAEEIGCHHSIVARAVKALKITPVASGDNADLERADAYDAAMREVRAPKLVPRAGDPPGLTLWDDIRTANNRLLRARNAIKVGVTVTPQIQQSLQTTVNLVKEIINAGVMAEGSEPE